ncbi:glycosyl transferase, family 25 [Gammaproteobacteria bacterium]
MHNDLTSLPIYVINLDRSPGRLTDISKNLNSLNLPYKRVRAIDGKQLSRNDTKEHASFLCNNFCTPSMIGCFLSHAKAWSTVIKNKDPYALILEDDCKLIPEFRTECSKMIEEVNRVDPEWDFVYGGYFLNLFKDTAKKDEYNTIFIPGNMVGFHCYFISLKGAHKLKKHILGEKGVTNHVDLEFTKKKHLFNVYACKIKLGYQNASPEQSTQMSNSYPVTLNTIAKQFKLTDIDMSFIMQAPIGQVMGIPINLYIILYVIFLVLLASVIPVNKKTMWIGLYTFFGIEFILNTNNIVPILTYIGLAHAILFRRK